MAKNASGAASNGSLDWLEGVRGQGGPIYLALARALEAAARSGELQPGDRLPPQRAVAERLGVDLTTVTRAYAAAQARGIVEAAVGRGTFVRPPPEEDAGLVDLSMNLPPPPEGISLGAMLRDTTASILQRADPTILMAYHPGFGTPGQKAAGARWLRPCLGEADLNGLLVAPGAQAALAAVLAATCKPGDAVVTEPLTYPGLIAVACGLGLRLLPCPADADGLVPEALDEICAKERPVGVYVVPTMQNPTASTLPLARRRNLARLAAARDLWIIEDDPYGRLMEAPPPAIATLAPERTFYVATLAKCLSPGLRIAFAACPPAWTERVAEALRAIALMPAPIMAAVATRWINDGDADTLLAAVRAEARARRALAAKLLPTAVGEEVSLHVWLPLAAQVSPDRLRLAAQARGLALVTAEAFAVGDAFPNGARISLGAPAKRATVEEALRALTEVVAKPEASRAPMV